MDRAPSSGFGWRKLIANQDGLYGDLNVSNLLDAEIRYPAKEFVDFERGLIGPGRIITATAGWEF